MQNHFAQCKTILPFRISQGFKMKERQKGF